MRLSEIHRIKLTIENCFLIFYCYGLAANHVTTSEVLGLMTMVAWAGLWIIKMYTSRERNKNNLSCAISIQGIIMSNYCTHNLYRQLKSIRMC